MKFAQTGLYLIFMFTVLIIVINTGAFTNHQEQTSGPSNENTKVSSLRGIASKLIKKRIAYAITVTKDGPFVDGAIVLGYAALKVHDPSKGYSSKYDADLVAFVTPSVVSARPILESHGWKILEKTIPVTLEEIENKHYVDKVHLFSIVCPR